MKIYNSNNNSSSSSSSSSSNNNSHNNKGHAAAAVAAAGEIVVTTTATTSITTATATSSLVTKSSSGGSSSSGTSGRNTSASSSNSRCDYGAPTYASWDRRDDSSSTDTRTATTNTTKTKEELKQELIQHFTTEYRQLLRSHPTTLSIMTTGGGTTGSIDEASTLTTTPTNDRATTKNPALCLNWRLPPEETYSDYTIEVVGAVGAADSNRHQEDAISAKTPTKRSYHVHKGILATGTKRCEYFATLFRNSTSSNRNGSTDTKRFQESCRSSRLVLPQLAADAFPTVLDYIYSTDDTALPMTDDNATALLFLADYLHNDMLLTQVQTYWQHHVTMENCHIYYQQVTDNFDNNPMLLSAIAECCAHHFQDLDPNNEILDLADTHFWIDVLHQVQELQKTDEERHADFKVDVMNWFIPRICEQDTTRQKLELTAFRTLIGREYLPTIYPATAVQLLRIEDAVDPQVCNEIHLSSFHSRCACALALDWRNLQNENGMFLFLAKRPAFMAALLEHTLFAVKRTVQTQQEQLQQRHLKQVDEIRRQHQRIIQQFHHDHQITVQGAGRDEINGTYFADGTYDGAVAYVKVGTPIEQEEEETQEQHDDNDNDETSGQEGIEVEGRDDVEDVDPRKELPVSKTLTKTETSTKTTSCKYYIYQKREISAETGHKRYTWYISKIQNRVTYPSGITNKYEERYYYVPETSTFRRVPRTGVWQCVGIQLSSPTSASASAAAEASATSTSSKGGSSNSSDASCVSSSRSISSSPPDTPPTLVFTEDDRRAFR